MVAPQSTFLVGNGHCQRADNAIVNNKLKKNRKKMGNTCVGELLAFVLRSTTVMNTEKYKGCYCFVFFNVFDGLGLERPKR